MFKKVKILVSLVVLMLVVCGSINSLATEITAVNRTGNTTVITPITATKTNTTGNSVSITATNKVNNVATNSVNKVNNVTNTSQYESATNSTKLPYAGTNSSVIFIVLGFVASAVYAYKKVSEYNV